MAEVEFDPGALSAELIRQLDAELTGRNGLAQQAIQRSHRRLREYDEYQTESVIDSLRVIEARADPEAGEITLAWEWTHPAAEFFEYGTSDHTIHGDPVLSFVWEERHDPPEWVKEEFDQARGEGGRFQSGWRVFLPEVDVEGVAETRFARVGREWLQQQLARRFG